MRLAGLIFLWITSFALHAQKGGYFLSHYNPADDRIDFRSIDMVQDVQGEIYFANKGGVLEFDGKNWQITAVPGAVNSLALYGNQVFVAGLAGAGMLDSRKEHHRPFVTIESESDFFATIAIDETIYFCGKELLMSYSAKQKKTNWVLKPDSSQGSFMGAYDVNGNLYVRTLKRGLLQVKDQKLMASDITPGNLIFSSPDAERKKFLVGMSDNRIFIHENNDFRELILKDQNFLNEHVLVDGAWVNNTLIALGTLRGGVLFVNPQTGVTVQVVDYLSGLPDNEVYALMTDRRQGVWVAHEYGFTRIAPNIPFRSFNHFTGLAGNLLCAQSYQGKVFVGTTLGLFQLTEDIPAPEITPVKETKTAKGKKGSNKKKKAPIEVEKKKDSIPATVNFIYKKVAGIEGKVIQLANVNGKFIASGLSGVFEIDGTIAKPIIEEPVRSVFFSPSSKLLFIGTYGERIKTMAYVNGSWQETNLLDSLHDLISHAFEDRLENIWLCGRTKVYKIETVDGDVTDIIGMPINNPSQDETVGLAYGTELYIAASGQFSRYDGHRGFVKFDSLPGPKKYFASAGYFWFNDGTRWRTVDKKMQSLKLNWLGLFPNLRYLAPDNQGESLWVISANNELYKFTNTIDEPISSRYPLFLRDVRGQEVEIAKQIEIEQNENSVVFEFIQPDYLGTNTTQYRYQLKGLNALWSAWSASNNTITFSYLPAGKYWLAIQSRDLLGTESSIEQVDFRVLPPYWKRWWFYALEFIIFSVLVILSMRLGRANTRYRYISQILSLLTVVMLIQFLQTVISALIGIKTSPVIEFMIQVFIALAVFPVEIFARDAMTKYSQGKYQITRSRDKRKSKK